MNTNNHWLDVTDFGAKGDGLTDDTAAFRAALEAAGKVSGTVFVPDGVYLCGELRLPPHTGLVGNATWAYRTIGGSILKLHDPAATCLLNITGAPGATINGLSLEGEGLGEGIHAIYMGPFEGKTEEDTPRIERVHIANFTGDGVRLDPVWCFSIRGCEIIYNRGNALYVKGWDGFILDNWFSGNGGAGYLCDGPNASITMTGNRIEWNGNGGIRIHGGSHYNITGNYIDRSGGPGISLLPNENGTGGLCFTITGNVIFRSGKPDRTGPDPHESSHVRLEGCHGVVFSGNSMCVGQDDGGGINSPELGIVLRKLKNCIVKDNTLHIGALTQLIVDLGEHEEGVIIADNVGNLYTDRDKSIWSSDQR